MVKFLILGHNGWIGQQLCKIFNDKNIQYITTTIRPQNTEQFDKFLVEQKPTHIYSVIGRTHGVIDNKQYTTIDYLEQDGKLVENIRDNLYCPLILAIFSQKYNIHLTYLGTGCIFKYDINHPIGNIKTGFHENDKPNFFGSSYSIVKGFTDQLCKLYPNVLNLRIRMPITSIDHPRNFITKITTYEKICSIPNSMTVLDELLPVSIDMAIHKRIGTINLTNPGVISHNEILNMYKEYVNNEFTWKNFTEEEQRLILASERSNNCLDTTKLVEWYPNIKPIHESIRTCIQKFIHK